MFLIQTLHYVLSTAHILLGVQCSVLKKVPVSPVPFLARNEAHALLSVVGSFSNGEVDIIGVQ